MYECILCACCSTSCPSYWWAADKYLGPAGKEKEDLQGRISVDVEGQKEQKDLLATNSRGEDDELFVYICPPKYHHPRADVMPKIQCWW